MQLIEFETRLEKNENEDSDRLYAFKTYAKVTLNFKDAKDIELTSTALHVRFLDSINWEEGTAFFEPFYLVVGNTGSAKKKQLMHSTVFARTLTIFGKNIRNLVRMTRGKMTLVRTTGTETVS